MKTKMITTIALIFGLTAMAFAQKGQKAENREEQKAKKVAYITERLALTPEEAKVFWPIYEQKNKDKREVMKSNKGDRKANPKKKIDEMTDDEVKTLLNKMIEKKQAELDIQKEYNTKFLSVLPAKKVAKLYHAEREFRKAGHKQKESKK